MLARLEIVNENGQLRIGLRPPSGGGWFDWGHHRPLTIHVTLPALAGATITGSGNIRVDRVQGPAFAGAVTGSGDLNIAALTAEQASFTITGSGDITAAGHAHQANASVTGSGDLHLAQLEAAAATLAVAGSGSIGIRATETAAIDLRGSGDINVAGPAVETNRENTLVASNTAGTDRVELPPPPPPPPLPVRRAAQIDASSRLQPPYPATELRAQRDGRVQVRVTIGPDGRVTDIALLSATSDAFWLVTREQALRHWRFRPATVDGRPVQDTKVMSLVFRIEDQG